MKTRTSLLGERGGWFAFEGLEGRWLLSVAGLVIDPPVDAGAGVGPLAVGGYIPHVVGDYNGSVHAAGSPEAIRGEMRISSQKKGQLVGKLFLLSAGQSAMQATGTITASGAFTLSFHHGNVSAKLHGRFVAGQGASGTFVTVNAGRKTVGTFAFGG